MVISIRWPNGYTHASAGQSHNFERKVLVTEEYHRVESKGLGSSIIGHLLKLPIVKFRICKLPKLVLCILHFSAYQFNIFL